MKYPEFTFEDYFFTFAWAFFLIVISHVIRQKYKDDPLYSYYLPHFYYSLVMGSSMAIFYILQYGGGDTTAYWRGANVLNQVFYESPWDYFEQIFSKPVYGVMPPCYNNTTGIPPVWIYYENSSWFICKIASFLSFFCFNSYLTLNLLFVFISSRITWRFFLFINNMNQVHPRYNAIAFLFIPTVTFWCSGLMKDTIVYLSILILIMQLLPMLNQKITLKRILISILCIYVIIATRSFVLIGIFVPYFLIVIFRLNSNKPFITRFITRIIGSAIALLALIVFMRSSALLGEFSAENLLNTAETIHTDFSQNVTYTGKRYDLGITEFSAASLTLAMPLTVITTLLRPFIWEVESPIMLMNALEGSVFLYFTFKLFKRRKNRLYKYSEESVQEKNLFWFCFFFVLIMSFFVGLTSGLFGVLARLKAPILPFFLILLFSKVDLPNKHQQISIKND